MKVKVFPVDDGACGNYRITWPAEVLIAAGHDVEIYPTVRGSSGLGVMIDTRTGEVSGIRHPDCDVLVLQRPTHRLYAQSIPFYRQAGVKVVIEIDDDLAHIPTTNDSHLAAHPARDKDSNYLWTKEACRQADAVVCTTPKLAEMYGGSKAVVVPNYVPSRYADFRHVEADGEPVCVGWAGNLEVHRGDLAVTRGRLASAIDGGDARFLLVGVDEHLEEIRREIGLVGAAEATGWFELQDYPKGLAMLDVGTVPLAPSVFNEAKSWLKGLEYAAVGVPFIASDTQPYRALAQLGMGEIARRPKDWDRALRRLIGDVQYRRDTADVAFECAQNLTIEGNAWRFYEAWTGA